MMIAWTVDTIWSSLATFIYQRGCIKSELADWYFYLQPSVGLYAPVLEISRNSNGAKSEGVAKIAPRSE